MAATLARHGGRIIKTDVQDEHLRIQVKLPQTAEVREVTAAVAEIHPDIEFVLQRTIEQENAPSPVIGTAIE